MRYSSPTVLYALHDSPIAITGGLKEVLKISRVFKIASEELRNLMATGYAGNPVEIEPSMLAVNLFTAMEESVIVYSRLKKNHDNVKI